MRLFLLATVLVFLQCPIQAQELGKEETFGRDGKLYSAERSGGDVIRSFLTSRQSAYAGDGVFYIGQIRTVTEVPGGGYSVSTTQFTTACVYVGREDQDLYVTLGAEGANQKSMPIKRSARSPPRSAINAYNLWWATCENKFSRFR